MSATTDPQPGHPAIQHLDKAFTNAPKLAGYLEYLAHPEQNYGPRLLDSVGSESSIGEPQPPNQNPPYVGSVLRELTIPEFFAAADVLSGQDVDALGGPVGVIEEMRHRKDGPQGPLQDTADVWIRLDGAIDALDKSWTSDSGKGVVTILGDMRVWYGHRTEKLFVMSKRLVEFGVAIRVARRNLNDLMGKLVDGLEAHTRDSGFDAGVFSIIGKVVGFGVGKMEPTGVASLVFGTFYDQAMKAAQADTKSAGLEGAKFYDILRSYLDGARQVCEDMADTVHSLLTNADLGDNSITQLRGTIPPPPTLRG
ncbi:hypothetical protein [Amycolatopsis sp. GM8]|uniref:hypothetical protein n=1 Tax=Amycolatopsis sp. GM8 TaxID=2896530 RepID=UPI001F165B7D|nr:hypothetical protein [Amycolatopsis sp. GM8]